MGAYKSVTWKDIQKVFGKRYIYYTQKTSFENIPSAFNTVYLHT